MGKLNRFINFHNRNLQLHLSSKFAVYHQSPITNQQYTIRCGDTALQYTAVILFISLRVALPIVQEKCNCPMMIFLRSVAAAACILLPSVSHAFSTPSNSNVMSVGNNKLKDEPIVDTSATLSSRRSLLQFTVAAAFASSVVSSQPSYAATDCFSDCLKVSITTFPIIIHCARMLLIFRVFLFLL